MSHWEYKVLVLPANNHDVDEEILNIHGEKGWELVSVLLDPSRHRMCYLRRVGSADIEDKTTELSTADFDATRA